MYAFYVFFTSLSRVIKDNIFLNKPPHPTDMTDVILTTDNPSDGV